MRNHCKESAYPAVHKYLISTLAFSWHIINYYANTIASQMPITILSTLLESRYFSALWTTVFCKENVWICSNSCIIAHQMTDLKPLRSEPLWRISCRPWKLQITCQAQARTHMWWTQFHICSVCCGWARLRAANARGVLHSARLKLCRLKKFHHAFVLGEMVSFVSPVSLFLFADRSSVIFGTRSTIGLNGLNTL